VNAERSFDPAFSMRRSISRTLSRYPSRTFLSRLPRSSSGLFVPSRIRIQQAVGAFADDRALLRRVSFTEQLQKDLFADSAPSAMAIPRRGKTAWNSIRRCPPQSACVVSEATSSDGSGVSWPMPFAIT
jgi:hypothetical protein